MRFPAPQIMLCLGRPADAWLATNPAQLYETIGWEDGRVRCLLFRAEVASRIGDRSAAAAALESAAQWVLHSGSVEHLCLYHLVRSRIAMNEGEFTGRPARASMRVAAGPSMRPLALPGRALLPAGVAHDEGIRMPSPPSTRPARRSRSPPRPSASSSGGSPGQATCWDARLPLRIGGRKLRAILEMILDLRKKIGDPRVQQTEALLQELSG